MYLILYICLYPEPFLDMWFSAFSIPWPHVTKESVWTNIPFHLATKKGWVAVTPGWERGYSPVTVIAWVWHPCTLTLLWLASLGIELPNHLESHFAPWGEFQRLQPPLSSLPNFGIIELRLKRSGGKLMRSGNMQRQHAGRTVTGKSLFQWLCILPFVGD